MVRFCKVFFDNPIFWKNWNRYQREREDHKRLKPENVKIRKNEKCYVSAEERLFSLMQTFDPTQALTDLTKIQT